MGDPLMQVDVADNGAVNVSSVTPEVVTDIKNTETLPLQSMLGLYEPSGKERTQLQEIYDYLSQKSNGTGDLLYQFKQLEARMSPPKLGESRLGKVYNYVSLQRQIESAEQQRNAL